MDLDSSLRMCVFIYETYYKSVDTYYADKRGEISVRDDYMYRRGGVIDVIDR